MRKITLLFLLFNFYSVAYNQIIKGTVRDQNSDSTINSAAIYFNGTFVGTLSDRKGTFELDISKNSSMPLTISALGYYSVTMTDFSGNKPLIIYLTPKIFELQEVVVTANLKASARERRAHLIMFKNEFLGKTMNALSCVILNEKDIKFKYNPDNDILTAFSSNPILIDNKALGYQIIYYINKFEYCNANSNLLIIGSYLFKEDSTSGKLKKKIFESRRKTAYLGSRMHFFRTLWEDNLDSAGFLVKNIANEKLHYYELVVQSDSLTDGVKEKYLKNNGNLSVTYFTTSPESFIYTLNEYVYFDKSGYFDPYGISWQGEMSKQRIADMLPFEYSIK